MLVNDQTANERLWKVGRGEGFGPLRKRRGAGEETRTLDIFLGKEVLYQLSYTRVNADGKLRGSGESCKQFFRNSPRRRWATFGGCFVEVWECFAPVPSSNFLSRIIWGRGLIGRWN
jgi:hypothetical protein